MSAIAARRRTMNKLTRSSRLVAFLGFTTFALLAASRTGARELRGALPASAGTMSLQDTLDYVNTFLKSPKKLYANFGKLHDRAWAAGQIANVVWRLANAAPIYCTTTAGTDTCAHTLNMNMKCMVWAASSPGFCFPQVKEQSNYAEWIEAYRTYLDAMKAYHAANPGASPSLDNFFVATSQEPAKHLFTLIKVFPRPDANPVPTPVGTKLDKVRIPGALRSNYVSFWIDALQDWEDQYRAFDKAPDPNAIADVDKGLKAASDALKAMPPDYVTAATSLHGVMNIEEKSMHLPCDPAEFPCNFKPASTSGVVAQSGYRCIPAP
jgi:hypothetical protein